MADRKIVEGRSIRLGKTYLPGQEEQLFKQITPENAERLKKQGVLEGDWSGAEGAFDEQQEELEARRLRRSPLGKAARALQMDPETSGQTARARREARNAPPPPEDPDEDYAKPFRAQPGAGGWYTFHDANDEQLRQGGKAVKVQGEQAANEKLAQLNAE